VLTFTIRFDGRSVMKPPAPVPRYTTAFAVAPLFSKKARIWMREPAVMLVDPSEAPPLLSRTSTVVPEQRTRMP
jgi:hypothetical protein